MKKQKLDQARLESSAFSAHRDSDLPKSPKLPCKDSPQSPRISAIHQSEEKKYTVFVINCYQVLKSVRATIIIMRFSAQTNISIDHRSFRMKSKKHYGS